MHWISTYHCDKYLSHEFSGDLLGLIKQNGVYPFELMDSFKKPFEDKLPVKYKILVLKMTILLKTSILVKKTTQHLLMFRMLSK